MKYDKYLEYLYTFSTLSTTTQHIYKNWITKCCQYCHKPHLLDLTISDMERFRIWLLDEKLFSPASDTIVYNAFKHTYLVLVPQVEKKETCVRYEQYFKSVPRQPHKLPEYVSQEEMRMFIRLLPHTVTGNIIRAIYKTSKPFDELLNNGDMRWKCSKQYAQQICAVTARKAGIKHGFGLTGVRGASIIHRIQSRTNDLELAEIKQDSGLSDTQFLLYLRTAGIHGIFHQHQSQNR